MICAVTESDEIKLTWGTWNQMKPKEHYQKVITWNQKSRAKTESDDDPSVQNKQSM